MQRIPLLQKPWLVVTALLVLSALVYQGYHLAIATGHEDTNHLETPLALALARQVAEGPAFLYGPYGEQRPLVLIHAPLYYRVAGLASVMLARMGADAESAALFSGRSLSLLSFLVLLGVVYRIARLDGLPDRAGLWAALLVASSAVIGSTMVTVRPDTLGIALQTLGLYLVLRSGGDGCKSRDLLLAYLAFGLAVCVKQHDLVLAGVCSLVLWEGCRRGRYRVAPVLGAHLLMIGVVVGYYGLEQWVTGGRMAESVFVVPAVLRRLAPADWGHVALVFLEVAKRSVGLLALVMVMVMLPGSLKGLSRVDKLLGACVAAELGAMVVLCLGSVGAWVNYAMELVVLLSVLTARGLARGLLVQEGRLVGRWLVVTVMLWMAVLILLGGDSRLVWISWRGRVESERALLSMLADSRVGSAAPEGLYFSDAPDQNRLRGRVSLAHDEWLYGAFEAAGAAEPRSRWLAEALGRGPVRVVVLVRLASGGDFREGRVSGLDQSLGDLGYKWIGAWGVYEAWKRESGPGLVRAQASVGR